MATSIEKRNISIPKSAVSFGDTAEKEPIVFSLENVLSEKECHQFIQEAENIGFRDAMVNVGGGNQAVLLDIRNSGRVIMDSYEKAEFLWKRIKPFIPQTLFGRRVMGLNERLRILRYDPGQFFLPHYDGDYVRDNGERSFITIHLYLNEGYTGGNTTFVANHNANEDRSSGPLEGDVEYHSKTGSILVFEHPLLHEGSYLKTGRKYTLRTDVMYSADIIDKAAAQKIL